MADTRELQILLTLKDQVSKELQKVDSKLGGFTSVLSKAAAGFAVVGAAATSFGLMALKAAADSEQTNIAFTTMLGSAERAKKFIADLVNFARTTPFELKGLEQAAKQLLAYGFAQEEVIPNLRALGNIAAGVGQDKLPNLILAFGQVKAATRLTGMELRQFTEAGVPLLDQLSKQFGLTVGEVQELVSAGKVGFKDVETALISLTEQGGRFENLMAKQADSLTGKVSNLRDAWDIFLRNQGAFLIEWAKRFVDVAIDIVQNHLPNWIEKTRELAAWIGTLDDQIKGLVITVSEWFNKLQEIPIITALLNELQNAFELVWTAVELHLWPALKELWNTVKNELWPALIELWVALQPFEPILMLILKAVGLLIASGLLLLVEMLKQTLLFLADVLTGFTKLIEFLVKVASGVIQEITGKINGLVDAFKSVVDWIGKAMDKWNQWKASGASLNPFSQSFKLPGFAEGGIVTRPTVAMVGEGGEPEAIIPFSKMKNFGMGGGVNVYVYGDVSGQELVNKVSEGIMNSLRLNARLPV